MSIINYIDPEKVTIAILRDWRDQHWKADHNKQRILEVSSKLTSTTACINKDPVKGGGSDHEEKLISGISKKDALEKGYRDAMVYINEIKPCWDRLTGEEQFLLISRFVDHEERNGIERIMNRFYISKTEAYNRSNAALKRLSKLLFW